MTFFERLAAAFRVARVGLPARTAQRSYAAAQPSRLTAGWNTPTSSADNEIRSSLTALRARSRALVRDSSYAKRARTIVMNNVIGSGIGLQSQVYTSKDVLAEGINSAVEGAWHRWSRASSCHTGGTLHFADLERLAAGEIFEAGEVFVRMHPSAFGDSQIPFALELIESERVPHEFQSAATVNLARMGIEVDPFFRPVQYWIRDRHPSDIQPGGTVSDNIRPVPASEIIHLRVVDRWPQTRGVPWLHAVAKKLNDMDGYSEAEIIAARATSQPIGWEESADPYDPTLERQEDGTYEQEWQPGVILRPPAGKKLSFYSPSRPNAALDPFMRYMLREVAAGVGVSYEALSRDYSQSNYSSSRLSLLDDRDLWRVLQGWFIRAFREVVHSQWMQQAVFAHAIPGISVNEYLTQRDRFEAARFRPRGWGWVDPTKEVSAYKDAVRCGFMTMQEVVATNSNGSMDYDELVDQREKEIKLQDAAGLIFDTDSRTAGAGQPAPVDSPVDDETEETDAQQASESDEEADRNMRLVK